MHGRQEKKKKLVKKGIKKKPQKKKATSEERQIDDDKLKPEETSTSPPQPEPSPSIPSPSNPSTDELCQADQSKEKPSSIEQQPAEIVISDDSSMEVEIKIVEETTPIHRQLTSFVSYFQ